MAFKKEGAEFTDTVRFKDYALSFVAEEASRFSNEDGDVASAKVDFALSSAASLSASKHTAKIKELRRFLKSKEIKDAAGNSGTGTKGREDGVLQSTAAFKRTEAEGSRMNTTKKQITKEKRQAARKTAVAKMLRAKGMVGNELGTEKVTGDAFRDGNSGAVRAITEILNPATYLKSLFVKIAGAYDGGAAVLKCFHDIGITDCRNVYLYQYSDYNRYWIHIKIFRTWIHHCRRST
mgnify:CR=1 FL=1